MIVVVTEELLRQAREFLTLLNVVRLRARVLPAKHPSVSSAIYEVMQILDKVLAENERLTLSIMNKELYVEGVRLANESILYEAMVSDLSARNLSSITFSRGLSTDEFIQFINIVFVKLLERNNGGVSADLQALPHVNVNELHLVTPEADPIFGVDKEQHKVSREVYQAALRAVVDSYFDARGKQKVNLELIDGVVRLIMNGVTRYPEVYFGLGALKAFSEYTFYHSVNVAILSMLMGSRLGFDDEQMHKLGMAALLHDIGKVNIPSEILDKPGRLTDDEFKIVREHPVDSARILAQHKNVDRVALIVAAQHHAHYDLSGYPDFRGMGELHLMSHIVTIADVYDALTSDRSYSKAKLPDHAMRILVEERGRKFHPVLTKVFAQITGMFPVGSLVELDTGEMAIVSKANPQDIYRPQVKLITPTHTGSAMLRLIDLREQTDGFYLRSIVRAVDPAAQGISIASVL